MPTPATQTGSVSFRGHQTWYRVTDGTPDVAHDVAAGVAAGRLPAVVLHGGPGAAHDYTLAMADLSRDGRAVVHYDQLGCGRSTHLPHVDPAFWTVELFVEELLNLLDALDLAQVHVIGQSWGGMLAPEFTLAHPDRVRSLTICDSPADMPAWRAAAEDLIDALPEPTRGQLLAHEAAGEYTHPEYLAALDVFYAKHVCRVQPLPPEVAATFAQIEDDPTVYHAMNGPSEFTVVGSMKDWTIIDRLGAITTPTLVVAGAHDEAGSSWKPFAERIPGARSHVFPDSSHMPHVEEPEAFLDVVGTFLQEND